MLKADSTITLVCLRGQEKHVYKVKGLWTHELANRQQGQQKAYTPASTFRVRIPLVDGVPEIMIGDMLLLGDVNVEGKTWGEILTCQKDAFKAMAISENRTLTGYGDHVRVYGDG